MVNNPKWDKVFSFVSWIIVFALLYAVVSLWITPPSGAGPVANAAGALGAQIFYTLLYLGEAAFLGFAKFFKKKKMRSHTLLVIYLTGFFTSLLTIGIIGWTPKLIDNIVTAAAAAFCWLYWKFKTQYIDTKQFDEDVWKLRKDTPNY